MQQGTAAPLRQCPVHRVRIGGADLRQAGQQFVGGDAHVLESATTLISKEYRSAG